VHIFNISNSTVECLVNTGSMEPPDPSPFSTGSALRAAAVTVLPVASQSQSQSQSQSNSNSNSNSQSQSQSRSVENEEEEEEDDIAFAAEAAANAVEEADAEQQRLNQSLLRCRVCGQGVTDGRPLLRFMPMDPTLASLTTQALPQNMPPVNTFPEDVCLHVFCGKTASILPTVNQPDLEILTKAGLKNKHGIGAEVNAALARTRCASLVTLQDASEENISSLTTSTSNNKQEKQYFLVREFEAHLVAIRSTHAIFTGESSPSSPAAASANAPALPMHSSSPGQKSPSTSNTSSTPDGWGKKSHKTSQRKTATVPSPVYPPPTSIMASRAAAALPGNMSSPTTSASTSTSTSITKALAGVSPAPSISSLSAPASGPFSHHQPLTSKLVDANKGRASSQSQGISTPPAYSNSGLALPQTGIMMGSPPHAGLTNDAAYPHPGNPYVQMMPQQNLMLRPPPAGMFTNMSTTGNNMNINSAINAGMNINMNMNVAGQLGQAPIPPPIGAVPLPPPLPRGQQLPLPGMTTPNTATQTQMKNSIGTGNAVGGVGGNNASSNTGSGKGKSTPPKRAAAGKTLSKPQRENEKQEALPQVKCGCGAIYFGAVNGWRDHLGTKEHQRWLESQVQPGQLGQNGNNSIA
jgi:hypothetical protein